MPDLDEQLRSLIDGSRRPIELDAILEAGMPIAPPGAPHRAWWRRAALGAAALVLVAVSAVVLARDAGEPVTTGPTTTAPSTTVASTPEPPSGPQVVVAPARVADLVISTSPLVPAREPECPDSASCISSQPWLQHVVTITNEGDETIYLDDTRTSTFTAGAEVLVGEDGCGWATLSDDGDAVAGFCQLFHLAVSIAPGESAELRFTLWKELRGMEPLASPAAWWSHELRYDTIPFIPEREAPSPFAYLDIAYFGLVPGATPTPAGSVVPLEVSLWHCGIEPINFEGQSWEVPDDEERFDATNAPAWFAARGTVGRSAEGSDLVYTDESGLTLRFVPDDGVEPPCN